MIHSKKDYHFYCDEDTKALFFGRTPSFVDRIKNPILRYQKQLRKCEFYRNVYGSTSILYIISKLKLRRMSYKLGIQIPENTFGPGLRIAHWGTIIVNPRCRIGGYCTIHAGTNIGVDSQGGVPIIGDRCYIGPGAKIFGEIVIEDDCKIGANAVVNKSFSAGSTIVGVPGTTIEKETRDT